MRNVRVNHEQVVGANARHTFVLYGTTMNCNAFTKNVIVTNKQFGTLTSVFLVLAVFAD